MNNLPWFPMFAKDWLVSTMEMTNAEKGAYIDLLCMQWENGYIGRVPSRYISKWGTLKSKFEKNANGNLFNPRLQEIRNEKEQTLEKQRLGGIKGARSRYRVPNGLPNRIPSGYSESESEPEKEPEPKKKKKKRREYPPEFERLWKIHPKGGKIAALKAFEKLDLDVDVWIEKLLAFKKTKQWREGYAPHLNTWLNQGQFDGEIENSIGGEEYDEQKRQERATREESQRLEALREANANAAPPAVAREHMDKILGRTE